jgi:hypothetical protein
VLGVLLVVSAWLCCEIKAPFALVANVLCFDDSPPVVSNRNISAKSLMGWWSADVFNWTFQGIITNARDYVSHKSTASNTEENDTAMVGDGKTVMIVMKIDGDCNSASAMGLNECGLYWPYYQTYSSDLFKVTIVHVCDQPSTMTQAGGVFASTPSFSSQC